MKKNNFMEGALIATLAIIISKILGVIYVIPFSKIIGAQGGALYGYAYNIYNIFLIISSAGIPLAISKLTTEYETKKEHTKKKAMYNLAKKAIYVFSLVSFVLCFFLAEPLAKLILGELTGGNTIEDVTFVIKCVSFALLVVPILSISRGYLQGHKYIGASAFSQVIEQLVRIAIILAGSYVSIKYFHVPLKIAVGISVFAACISALIAYCYLLLKMRKLRRFENVEFGTVSKKEKKEIVSKLIGYSIPFIIINVISNLYNTTDMILMIRGLNWLKYPAQDIETISSIFTTWGNKLLSIVKAFASGLTISLIPALVNSYIKKDDEKMNNYFNKALAALILIIIPITIFMSIFAKPIWNVFYEDVTLGPNVFKFYIILAFFESAYLLITTTLQSIYKTKLVYLFSIIGLGLNLLLDIPFMFLFNKLGFDAYNGAILASCTGYTVSTLFVLIYLNRKERFNYKETYILLPRFILSLMIIIPIALLYKNFVPTANGYIMNLVYIGVIGIIYVALLYILNMKNINTVLNDKIKNKQKQKDEN